MFFLKSVKISSVEKKSLCVRDFLSDYWNEKSSGSKLELFDLFSENLVIDSPICKKIGRAALAEINAKWDEGFPDMQIYNMEAESFGDTVVVSWRSTASHLGNFQAVTPSEKRIHYTGETIFFFKEGKVVRYLCKIDMVDIYHQLGMRIAPEDYAQQEVLSRNKALLINKIQKDLSSRLTEREIEMLSLYLLGLNAKQIGILCSISHRTVETHLSKALHELSCTNKHQCLEKIISLWMLPIFQDLSKILLSQYGAQKKSLSFS